MSEHHAECPSILGSPRIKSHKSIASAMDVDVDVDARDPCMARGFRGAASFASRLLRLVTIGGARTRSHGADPDVRPRCTRDDDLDDDDDDDDDDDISLARVVVVDRTRWRYAVRAWCVCVCIYR